jgi:hypothetical protein
MPQPFSGENKMMRFGVGIFLMVLIGSALPGRASEKYSDYHLATIAKVERHVPTSTTPKDDVVRYDIELNVGDTTYVVLLTPDHSSRSVEYVAGRNVMVSVGQKTMKFKDLLGRTKQAVILSSRQAPDKKTMN